MCGPKFVCIRDGSLSQISRMILHVYYSFSFSQGIIGSFCESAGLSMFIFGILNVKKDPEIAVVLMNAVFVVPVVWQMTKACVERFTPDEARSDDVPPEAIIQHKKKHMTNMILALFAIILQVGGLLGIVYIVSIF